MHIPNSFFLTADTKKRELRYLKDEIDKNHIDKRMLPYLKVVNKIDGVVSNHCCSGHTKRERRYPADEGHLIVWISEKKYRQLFFNHWTSYIWSGPKYKGGISQITFDNQVMVMFRWHRSYLHKAMKEALGFLKWDGVIND